MFPLNCMIVFSGIKTRGYFIKFFFSTLESCSSAKACVFCLLQGC